MKRIIIGTILFILLFNFSLFAQEVAEEKPEDKYFYSKVLDGLSQIDILTKPIKRHLRKNNIDLNFFAGILQGYDNNVNLDPDRKKDTFTELSLNTEVTYNYTDDVRLKLKNDTTDIIYYTVNSASLLDIYSEATLEMDMFDDMFTFGLNYALDYVLFPNDEDGTYLSNQAEVFVRQNILPNLYHKIGYSFLHKGYSHNKTLDGKKVRTDLLRKDGRDSIEYEAGIYLFDRAIIKTDIQFYRNNSNYQYYDYYDYWSFKIRPSCIFMLTKKLYTSGSFTYQQRRYDDRLSSEDDEHVYDDTCSFNISVLYDLTKSFTFALNLSYRENSSNEPLQKYSGSMVTAGLYYSF